VGAAGFRIPTAVVYAFDRRTRMLPYVISSRRMAPAGARAVGSALFDCGIEDVRIVLQQWTPRFRPSLATVGGSPIEMLLVSSMQIHAEKAYSLIEDAHGASPRPLILAGGPKAIYEPWDLFEVRGRRGVSADLAVTGEEFVLVSLLEVLLSYRGACGSMLEAFRQARREGAFDHVPGLMYRRDDSPEAPLVDTGIQRLVQDLDEMPHTIVGYRLLEAPHWGTTLRAHPLADRRVRWQTPISSMRLTHGCKFNCDYCPIPAYNQRTFRHKSAGRIIDEMRRLREELGLRYFFGTDDNFFNNRAPVEEMLHSMAREKIAGVPMRRAVRWGTEATEFDTWRNRDLLPAARKAGLSAIWFGIEDLTATLIKKGQSVNKTVELFGLLKQVGISPMPMMMHHDGQPLYTRKGLYGLLNQVQFLRRHGAPTLQVTVLTPAVGTRSYDANFENELVFKRVAGREVLQHQFDGNHVVASDSRQPWKTQLNVLAAYASFYNPLNLVRNLVRPGDNFWETGIGAQLSGMAGLVLTAVSYAKWSALLAMGPIERQTAPPQSQLPIVSVGAGRESSAESVEVPQLMAV